MTFYGVAPVSTNQRPHVFRFTAASQRFQIARVANFPASLSFYSYVTTGREPSVHSAWKYDTERILTGGTIGDRYHSPSFWGLVETCVACVYNIQNIDETAAMLKLRNTVDWLLYWQLWLALVILGFITEKLSLCTFILPWVLALNKLAVIVNFKWLFYAHYIFDL